VSRIGDKRLVVSPLRLPKIRRTGVHMPMYRRAHIILIFSAALLARREFADAQDTRENITVDSVLTMAKEAAETAEYNRNWHQGNRIWLRGQVADAIHRLGRDTIFGDYIEKAVRDVRQHHIPAWQSPFDVYGWAHGQSDEAQRLRHENAKQLFLSGDIEGSRKLLGAWYHAADVIISINDDDFFFHWELESGRLDAALHRFREKGWGVLQPRIEVQLARAYVVAGRHSEIRDILSNINDRWARYFGEHGVFKSGASIRHLVSEGDATAAVNEAQRAGSPGKQVAALIIIAEALAGVPGLPDEELSASSGEPSPFPAFLRFDLQPRH